MSFAFQENHGWMDGQIFQLKEDTRADNHTQNKRGDWISNPFVIKAGTKVKVVMVSRFGDCGITTDLAAKSGYTTRVLPSELEEVPGTTYNMVVTVPKGLESLYGTDVAPQMTLKELAVFDVDETKTPDPF